MEPEQPKTTIKVRYHNIGSVLAHALLFSISLLIAFELAYNFDHNKQWFFPQYMMAWPAFLLIKYLVFAAFQQHQRSWRYTGYRDFVSTGLSSTAATAVLYLAVMACKTLPANAAIRNIAGFPGSVLLIDWILSNVLVLWSRFSIRFLYEQGRSSGIQVPRKLIIGAGDAGETLLREIQRMPVEKHRIVGFLDDDYRKLGKQIHGVKVLGPIEMVKHICNTHLIDEVLVAIPSAPQQRIREIIHHCEGANVSFRIVPSLTELIEGSLTIESQLRPISLEDLLTRELVELDHDIIGQCLRNKVIMVTGAGGSIGSEMCRQITSFSPKRLILVEQSENNLFDIERELREEHQELALTPYLADICDEIRISRIFRNELPDMVCHAAAHKHVPMMEAHPGEGIKNNIVGTITLANQAVKHGVEKFVYISTDKAVNPTSIMGCTKRIAEMYVQGLSEQSGTQFITTRFGNVLGSRGSVVPIFQEQIAKGGPVTITHPEITRYFMTIQEAAQLVLQAGTIGKGGEIFLLNMGEPVQMVALAKNLITLSGLTPGVDIDIIFTGLRPGEKLYEELYIDGEDLAPTSHPNIRVWTMKPENWDTLLSDIPKLVALADHGSSAQIKASLAERVPEYQPDYTVAPPATQQASP